MPKTIAAAAFVDRLKRGEACCVLDVRTPPEYREVRMKGDCIHLPLDALDADGLRQTLDESCETLFVLCRSGQRARKAADLLKEKGVDKAVVVDGGLEACIDCGADVARGDVMSLERQVRVAAGVLVVTGVALGTFINPAFYALSGLVGAGLIFAGLTGWCGMAMLLAKAPWNK